MSPRAVHRALPAHVNKQCSAHQVIANTALRLLRNDCAATRLVCRIDSETETFWKSQAPQAFAATRRATHACRPNHSEMARRVDDRNCAALICRPRGYCLPSRALWVTMRTVIANWRRPWMPAPAVFVVVVVDRNASSIICRRRRRVPPQGMPRSGRSCVGACQVSETSVPGQAHQSEFGSAARSGAWLVAAVIGIGALAHSRPQEMRWGARLKCR